MSSPRFEDNLTQALRGLARETANVQTPERVRSALLRELGARRRAAALRLWLPIAAAVVVVIAVWGVMGRRGPDPQVPGIAAVQPPPAPLVSAFPEEPVPERASPAATPAVLRSRPSAARIPAPVTPWYFNTTLPVSAEGHVVSVAVDAAVASQFGVYSRRPSVQAQIFVGDDGLARAIRFVQ